jgi:hypothetical protein
MMWRNPWNLLASVNFTCSRASYDKPARVLGDVVLLLLVWQFYFLMISNNQVLFPDICEVVAVQGLEHRSDSQLRNLTTSHNYYSFDRYHSRYFDIVLFVCNWRLCHLTTSHNYYHSHNNDTPSLPWLYAMYQYVNISAMCSLLWYDHTRTFILTLICGYDPISAEGLKVPLFIV